MRAFDQLDVDGSVILAGTLNLSLINDDQSNGFVPAFGDKFTIIDNDGMIDAVIGTFDGLAEGAVGQAPRA